MHVDFACLFDHGLNLETPEKVPFRLTQNLLHAMGAFGADGAFRQVSELTLEQLRSNRSTLINVLSTPCIYLVDQCAEHTLRLPLTNAREGALSIRLHSDSEVQ